jgi:hypothetical protein
MKRVGERDKNKGNTCIIIRIIGEGDGGWGQTNDERCLKIRKRMIKNDKDIKGNQKDKEATEVNSK